jgi:hypothetical protein
VSISNPSLQFSDKKISNLSDGRCEIEFKKGKVSKVKLDSTIEYDINNKTITSHWFVSHWTGPRLDSTSKSTTKIILHLNSIELRKNTDTIILKELNDIKEVMSQFGIGYLSEGQEVIGLAFSNSFTQVNIPISTIAYIPLSSFNNTWRWNVDIHNKKYSVSIHNSYRKLPRVQSVSISDSLLERGIVLYSKFRSSKYTQKIESAYDKLKEIRPNGAQGFGFATQDPYFYYHFKRNGKLHFRKSEGRLIPKK